MKPSPACASVVGSLLRSAPKFTRKRLIAAVHDVIENRLIAALHIDGFENEDIHRIFDPAALVIWRFLILTMFLLCVFLGSTSP